MHAPENILGDRLAAIAELNDDDRASLLNVIDGLVTKSRVRTLAGGVS
jgi:gluconate kinase